MNVGELRALIEHLDDETPVLSCGGDHNHYDMEFFATTALFDEKTKEWTEDFNSSDPMGQVTEYGVRKLALCLR